MKYLLGALLMKSKLLLMLLVVAMAFIAASARAASLTGDETITTTPNVSFGTETQQLAGLLNDPFAYDSGNPTSPMPQITWEATKFFIGTDTYLATIAYNFDGTYENLFVDLYGRDSTAAIEARDDFFDVEFRLAGVLQETIATGIDSTHHVRVTASPSTQADSIRIVETAALPDKFALAEIRVRGINLTQISALTALKNHILSSPTLSPSEIAAHKATIDANKSLFGSSSDVMTAGFDLVETYETTPGFGPLWINTGNFSRSGASDDIHWTMYWVMQYIMDETYTSANISSHEILIDGFKFESSSYFPGEADPPVDPEATHTVSIDGTYLDMWGHEIMHEDRPARRPTGTYLAPGSIATITVPSSIVGRGYQVRVGCHSWDHSNRPTCKRLDRSSLVYTITSTETKVASPLGGGIYIEVPEGQNAGIVSVQIKNAIRSPYFSAKSFHTTTLSEWINTERHHPGPWADFQSEKFMMNVPTDWIYNYEDPATMLADWDTATDAVNNLMGYPARTRESLYPQVDVQNRASVLAPGYPSCNASYNPNGSSGGNNNHYLLNGPRVTTAPGFLFHEEGHGYFFQKFGGETESNVNLLHVPVYHEKFGKSLDYAFASSRDYQGNPHRTLNNTAVAWMTSFGFSPRNVEMATAEKVYQLKGHAKFVDIAKLFGWDVLGDYWYSFNEDYENSNPINTSKDGLILRLSIAVGFDVRPLFHFWGIHPTNNTTLGAAIAAEGLFPSVDIYKRLMEYKSILPANNAEFQTWAFNWWEREPRITPGTLWTETEHARQWDTQMRRQADIDDQQRPELTVGEMYIEAVRDDIQGDLQTIIDLYFPDGIPDYTVELFDMVSWSAQETPLAPVVDDAGSTLNFAWTADPTAGVVFTPNDGGDGSTSSVEAPTVTITKPAGDMEIFKLELTISDGVDLLVRDSMTIEVYDDTCKAARLGMSLAEDNPTDLDGDCVTGIEDVAAVALKWLNDEGLASPQHK
jgi:hypothetical protein